MVAKRYTFLGYLQCNQMFLYARHLTAKLWYGVVRRAVRPYVRSVVHNSCAHDKTRTMWPICSNLVCTLHMVRIRSLFIFKVKGQSSR